MLVTQRAILLQPTEETKKQFEAHVLYTVNPERVSRGLKPITVSEAREYLCLAWEFAERFANLRVRQC